MKKKYVMKLTPIIVAGSLLFVRVNETLAKPSSHLYDVPKIYAVENRRYQTNKELTMHVGYLPSDAFNKGYLIGGSYTHFFNSYLGWEVVNLNYSFNQATHLKKDLMDCCALEVQNVGFNGALDYIQWYGLSNLVYTPFYTKYLLFNRKVIHGEFSLVGGYGAAHFAHTGTKGMFSGFNPIECISFSTEGTGIALNTSLGLGHMVD